MNIIKGMSHALIFFSSKQAEAATGVGAMMKLCFGSDENCISQILYKRPAPGKNHEWVLPERTGTEKNFPVFNGEVGEELTLLAGRTATQFRNYYTTGLGEKAGRAWRVTAKGIEEVIQKTEATTK